MTERQKQIFQLVIQEFIQNAKPVSSALLAKKCHLPWSTATIRQELNALEGEGNLTHLYTSSGRVPTDKGYRFFIDAMMEEEKLSQKDQDFLREELLGEKKHHSLMRTSAKLLALYSQNMAISGVAGEDEWHEAGVSYLLACPEFKTEKRMRQIMSICDCLGENLETMVKEVPEYPVIYIGEENPFVKAKDCSMILSVYHLFSKEKALIAIIGPKRMRYPRNMSLIKYFIKVLGGSLGVLFIIVINYV